MSSSRAKPDAIGSHSLKAPRHTPEAVASLENERNALEALQGEAVVALHDVLRDGTGHPLLVLEYGESLDDTLDKLRRRNAALDETTLRRMQGDLVRALAFVHARGYVHGDVKPENVLLKRGAVKLCDFGDARVERPRESDPPNTTLPYRAPELILARPPYTRAADVWALACTLYEMATRELLFDPEDDETWSDNDDVDARHLALMGDLIPASRRKAPHYTSRGEAVAPATPVDMGARLVEEARLEDTTPLAAWLGRALRFAPGERATCKALLEDPWLA